MSQRNARISAFFCVFSLFVCTSLARHAHRRPVHRHASRADLITTDDYTTVTNDFMATAQTGFVTTADTTANAPSPSFTAGDAVIDDILKTQIGLNELPEGLLSSILALEQRLEEVEKLLSGYDGSDPPAGPVGPVLSPAPSPATQDAPEITSPDISTSRVTKSATTSLCKPLGGAGPLRPCGGPDVTAVLTTRSTRITRTMTLMTTIAPAFSISTGIGSNHSFPAMNGSDFTPPAPWTKPYIAFGAYTTSSFPSHSDGPNSSATLASTAETTIAATASSYTFNAESEDNVAVYYGTTPATTAGGLTSLCSNPDVDIVILSFVFSFFDANGYPSIDFGPGCSSQTSAQADTAPGLKDCSALAPQITACQAMDKKVLLSLGGYNSNTSFASETQATTFASTLWDLFGAGDSLDAGLRPFGTEVIVDGFDLDNENHSTEHYETFATALRERFTIDDSKTYYLSAAPQCPIPDESIPLGALQQADFVWVQFYNNPSCNIDTPGFRQSFQAWSDLLASGTQVRGPRLYIGAAGFEGAGTGYVKGSGLGTRVSTARGLYVENFGGVMLWDGSEAALNVDQYGVDYLEYAKTALH
jgi:chitinase